MNERSGPSIAGLFTAVLLALAPAVAQNSDPFFDSTVQLSQAYGLEMINVRMIALEAFEPPVNEELAEQVEEIFENDLPRFAGTLADRDANLHSELVESLEALEEAVEVGRDADGEINDVRVLLGQAREVLIDEELRDSTAFTAALMGNLLLLDGGVAEGYEEAAEGELWEFSLGWAALQRLEQLWTHLEPQASEQQRADVQEMFDFIAGIYPEPTPPDAITGSPEEAEAPAHRVVGLLEGMTNASLVPGRDLARLSGHLADTAAPFCEEFAQERQDVGIQGIFAIIDAYDKHLQRLLDLMAPETDEIISRHLENFVGNEPDGDAAEACTELVEALREGQAVLGG